MLEQDSLTNVKGGFPELILSVVQDFEIMGKAGKIVRLVRGQIKN